MKTATQTDFFALLGPEEAEKLVADLSEPGAFNLDVAAFELFELHGQDCARNADEGAAVARDRGLIECAEKWEQIAAHCRFCGLDKAVWPEPSAELRAAIAEMAKQSTPAAE